MSILLISYLDMSKKHTPSLALQKSLTGAPLYLSSSFSLSLIYKLLTNTSLLIQLGLILYSDLSIDKFLTIGPLESTSAFVAVNFTTSSLQLIIL